MSALRSNYLAQTYPNASFAVYDYKNNTRDKSLPLVLFLQTYTAQTKNTMKIGMIATDAAYIKQPIMYGRLDATKIVDLRHISDRQLEKDGWIHINAKAIYDSTEFWYTKK